MTGYEPGDPGLRDLSILALLHEKKRSHTEVCLADGRSSRVWDIAWGYDAGDFWRTTRPTTARASPSRDLAGASSLHASRHAC
jgi:hypothetical protein